MRCSVVALVVASLLLSGCGTETSDAVQSSSDSGGVTVLVSKSSDAGMDALGGGRLEVLGGCLGASGSMYVWPKGTEVVRAKPLTIEIPDTGTFAVGDDVRVGGGFVLEHSSDDVTPGDFEAGGVTVPADCAEFDIFVAN